MVPCAAAGLCLVGVLITFRDLNLTDVLHVCKNMRLRDWQEVINSLPSSISTPDQIAMLAMQASAFGLVCCRNGVPVAVIQYSPIVDGSWRAGLFATDEWPTVKRAVVRKLADLVPFILDQGVVYCDAYSDMLHDEAHRMLEFLGFKRRAILEGYGSRGRDFALYVLTKRDVEENVFRRRHRQRGTI